MTAPRPAVSLLLLAALSLGTLTQCAAPFTARASDLAAPSSAAPTGARFQAAGPLALSPQATRDLLEMVEPPASSEADLVRRFKQSCGTPAAAAVPLFLDEAVGASRPIWVLDDPNHRFFQVQSTLRYASPHLLFYVQDGVQLDPDALAASANVFEQRTYPLLRQFFGDLPEEPRITVFNGRVPGVGGYFSAGDLFPRSVNPYSNERVMIYMNLDSTRPGGGGYDSTLAHEAQHFVHYLVHPQQDSWLNEGASELAMAVAGYSQAGTAKRFLDRPDTQLDAWAEQIPQTGPYYGGGYLFLEYFAQRLGGYEKIKDLIASPGVSTRTVENYLRHSTAGGWGFDDLFRDFVVANLLNDRSVADGRFGYERLSGKAQIASSSTFSFRDGAAVSAAESVRPYATRYVDLQPAGRQGTLELRFSGAGTARLFGDAPHSGRAQWWGNAADEMESTLTREFDLSGVDRATLTFSAWYDVERDYDYAGVAVSTDGGCTWQTLAGQRTTDADPLGQNLGHGFTGQSGGGDAAVWVDESMDLTPYAGRKVLVRFFNLTDQSYHGSGVAIDDISIPEIGFADDAESDQGWQANGFLRSVNATTLDWAVQVITFSTTGTQVLQMPVRLSAGAGGEGGETGDTGPLTGALVVPRFGSNVSRVVVAISPLVPVTLVPVDFTLDATMR